MTTIELFASLILLAVVIVVVWGVSLYNQVQRLLNIIPEMHSNIAVLIKKRTDLIGKLISIVDSYGLHESSVQGKVSGDFGGTARATPGIIERLASLRMAFPELKADGLYENLMQQLAEVEEDIATRREQYNSTVRSYNTVIVQFPGNVLLTPFHFQAKPFLSDQELSDPPYPTTNRESQ
ncbi:MAG: hypothetical protein H6R18_304 [Proteobacteria bacterium]|nr:hypothetical protein [Pseudomonadota bacterium]